MPDPEASEADVIEQAQEQGRESADAFETPTLRDDVPEADALEQASDAGLEDDDRRES